MATATGEHTLSAEEGQVIPTPAGARTTPFGVPMVVYQVALGLGALALWQFSSGRWVKELFVSSPLSVARQLAEYFMTGEIWLHIRVTLLEFGVGYLIGAVAGIVCGVLLARTRFLAGVLDPYLVAFYSVPKIALAPLFIIWLGIDTSPKIAIAAISSFFLVFINTFAGIRGINEEFVNLAMLMGASRSYVVRRILLPSAAPEILLGLRASVPYAMIGAVVGEFIASNRGLGFLMLRAAQMFDTAALFAAIIINVVLVVAVTQLLALIQRAIIRWQPVTETRVEI